MRKYAILFILFLSSVVVKSQDFMYTNYLMSPIYLNPALTGVFNGSTRLIINYRDQYPGIKNAYKYAGFSYDQNVDIINGAYAISYDNSREGAGSYSKNSIGLTYAFHGIRFKPKPTNRNRHELQLSLALKGNYVLRSIDYDNLIFYDQIDIENGVTPGLTTEASYPINNNKSFADFSAGLSFIYRNLIGGFAVHHLSKPNESLISSESLLNRKFNLHLSHYYKLGNKRNTGKMMTSSINIHYQDEIPVLLLGYQFKYYNFTIGQWFRTATYIDGGNTIMWTFVIDDMQAQKGENGFSFGFSYDYNISGIETRNTYGSLEFNLLYQVRKMQSKRKKVHCPTF